MTDPGRYPIEELARAMGCSVNQACLQLGVSGTTLQQYRARGITDYVAESLCAKVGLHPFEVWGDMLDARVAEFSRPCDDCGEQFFPSRPDVKYCSRTCQNRVANRAYAKRRYETDPEYRRRQIEGRKAAWRDASPAARHQEALRRRQARVEERLSELGEQAVSGGFGVGSHTPQPGASGA